jgi:tetraprenyl-beta-curcumene synthase
VFSPARRVPPPSLHAGRLASTPAALSARQLRVLAHATVRELVWTLPAVAGEVRAWRALARTIPDGSIRHDALSALARKRGHTDGAALFCILTRRRDLGLLRLLVAYELLWDFLDSVNEHGAERGQTNGRQLHLALIEAIDRELPISDYYRYHPWREDGGYLKALVEACRYESARLPSYEAVRPLLVREAWRAQVLGINHELDPIARDRTLRQWVRQEWPNFLDAHWWELTGAASASLTVHALLALAARRHVDAKEIHRVYRAYGPWISAATTMLDSYVDQAEDELNGDHSYVAHYPSGESALRRVGQLVRRSTREASALPDAERHALIVAAMSAMYLSKDSARTPDMREQTRALIRAGGPLARLLLPVLRLWRVLYRQRST